LQGEREGALIHNEFGIVENNESGSTSINQTLRKKRIDREKKMGKCG
jgi:hypothetical protein